MEKYIEECLESVCNDRDADIEVICVNDGSTDGTLNMQNPKLTIADYTVGNRQEIRRKFSNGIA